MPLGVMIHTLYNMSELLSTLCECTSFCAENVPSVVAPHRDEDNSGDACENIAASKEIKTHNETGNYAICDNIIISAASFPEQARPCKESSNEWHSTCI